MEDDKKLTFRLNNYNIGDNNNILDLVKYEKFKVYTGDVRTRLSISATKKHKDIFLWNKDYGNDR